MAIFDKNKKATKKATDTKRSYARAVSKQYGAEHDTILAPWFSEKALIGTEKGVYVFSVPEGVTKAEVAGAIHSIYKVQPKRISLTHLPAKRKALRTRRGMGKTARRHKAYVFLHTGDTIQLA